MYSGHGFSGAVTQPPVREYLYLLITCIFFIVVFSSYGGRLSLPCLPCQNVRARTLVLGCTWTYNVQQYSKSLIFSLFGCLQSYLRLDGYLALMITVYIQRWTGDLDYFLFSQTVDTVNCGKVCSCEVFWFGHVCFSVHLYTCVVVVV